MLWCGRPIGAFGAHGAFGVLLACVWCVLVGVCSCARHETKRERKRERGILRPQKFVRMRVRVNVCVHVTGAVLARGLTCVGRLSEQPSLRWPKQGAAGDPARWRGERSGPCKVHRPTRRPMEGAVLFRPIMWLYSASGVLRFVRFQPAPCFGHLPTRCTLFWPLPFLFVFVFCFSQYWTLSTSPTAPHLHYD